MKKKMSISPKKFKVIPLVVAFEVVTLLLFTFWVSTYWAYAQQLENTQEQQQPTTASSPLPSPRLHAVKITSPTRGQEVPSGNNSNLTISGISIANATTSHCQVSVIVNDVWPYQPAIGTGPGGASDYSKWNFTLTPQYTTIKEGPNNKIVARYTCSDNPRIIGYYSVNVTGVAAAAAAPTSSSVP